MANNIGWNGNLSNGFMGIEWLDYSGFRPGDIRENPVDA
jgi:hypothetical protein